MVVLNVAFNIPVIAVDIIFFRVCNRTASLGKNALTVQKLLADLIDDEFELSRRIISYFCMVGMSVQLASLSVRAVLLKISV